MTIYTYIVEDRKTGKREVMHGATKSVIPSTKKLVCVAGSYEKSSK